MNDLIDKLTSFVTYIGLTVCFETIDADTFLPGILLRNGTLIIDKKKLKYPGDILHEAGHLAVMPPSIRCNMSDNLTDDSIHDGGELMAIAWSYAACIHLDIDPRIVFHDNGYKEGGRNIIENFSQGNYFGVPLLQWSEMTYDEVNAASKQEKAFPHMISWLCKINKYELQA